MFAALLGGTVICLILNEKNVDWKFLKSLCRDSNLWLLLFSAVILFIIEKDRIARSWDELGCWALEVKTLYLNSGFSSAKMHTAIGYADYFPGQMLFEWWVCHMQPSYFYEGLMYTGYYLFYAMFIVSAISYNNKKGIKWFAELLHKVLLVAVFLILPGCVSTFEYGMLSVEFLQSVIVGYFLYIMYLQRDKNRLELFDYVNWTALTIILILLKDSSIIFLVMLYCFSLCLLAFTKKQYSSFLQLACGGGAAITLITIWKYFVKVNDRGNPLQRSSAIVKLFKDFLNDPYSDPNTIGYAKSFWQSIIEYPLHITRKFGLNLSVLGAILLLCIILYLFYKVKILHLNKTELIIGELGIISMIVVYLVLLVGMHMFGFRETQYLEPRTMMYAISRYSEPIIVGLLLFEMFICVTKMSYKVHVIAIIGVLIFADYSSPIWAFGKYRTSLSNDYIGRENLKNTNIELFEYFEEERTREGRILLVYGEDTVEPTRRILQYLTAPRALYFYRDRKEDNGIQSFNDIKDSVLQKRFEYYYLKLRT